MTKVRLRCNSSWPIAILFCTNTIRPIWNTIRSLNIYPTYERMEEVYIKKAGNAYISGKYDRAIEDYNKILELFPDTKFKTDIVFGLGSCRTNLDDFEKAKQNYLQIRDTYPSPKVIDIRLAGIEKRRQKKSYRDTKL